jgi:hypothetical protein
MSEGHDVNDGIHVRGNQLEIPDLIRSAGDAAVRAYRAFLDSLRSPSTRRAYRNHVVRFCRWTDGLGLPLERIEPGHVAIYVGTLSPKSASDVVSVLRRLFGHIVAVGILAENPCADGRRRGCYRWWRLIPGKLVEKKRMKQTIGLTAREVELLNGVKRLLPSLAEAALAEARQNTDKTRSRKSYIDIELCDAAVAYCNALRRRAGKSDSRRDRIDALAPTDRLGSAFKQTAVTQKASDAR